MRVSSDVSRHCFVDFSGAQHLARIFLAACINADYGSIMVNNVNTVCARYMYTS